MENCLLCLDKNQDPDGCIKVNSIQWYELHIEDLIEKHFWPMQTTQTSSWLCTECWRELNDFHKFYERIENAHMSLKSIMKVEISNESNFETEVSIQNALLPDIVLEQQEIIVKEEIEKDFSEDDMALLQIRKTIQEENIEPVGSIVKDPLHTFKKSRRQTKRSIKSTSCKKGRKPKITKIFRKKRIAKEEQSEIELNPDLSEIKEESNEDGNSISDTDSHYKFDEDSTHGSSILKSQRTDQFLAENYKMTCHICTDSLDTFLNLTKHFQKEHDQPAYAVCCDKKYFKKQHLVDHVHQHLDPNYLKCDQCSKTFVTKRNLLNHSRVHDTTREKNHCCDICGLRFYNKNSLDTHKAVHMTEEEKKFPCLHCEKKFGNKYLLTNHVKIVHGNSPVNCDICGLVLSTIYALTKHKGIKHPVGEEVEYKCHICEKVSKNRQSHLVHIKYTHQSGFDYKCSMCDKAYKRPRTLKEHIATHHTGIDLYVCQWCPKTGKTKDFMRRHRKKYHPKEWEEEIRKKYSGTLPPDIEQLPPTNIRNSIPLKMQYK